MSSTSSGTDLPRLVLVGPHPYQLKFVSGLMHEEEEPLLGLCATDDLVIQLEEKQPESLLRETVLHEIVHAIASQFGLGDENTEEQWANAIGVGMLAVLRHNPGLTAWLTARTVNL